MRHPLKFEAFNKLKALDVPINSVIDVGVLNQTFELIQAFPDKTHLLVEPIVEWNQTIRANYSKHGIDFILANVAASNVNGTTNIRAISAVPGKMISHARLTELPLGSEGVRQVDVRTLDSLLAEHELPTPYLLKLDVDGVELLILEGARETVLPNSSVVVIEANIQNFVERATFLQNHGFELFDIVDPCYYDGRLRQFDLVLLNSAMVKERGLDMYQERFDYTKWENYSAHLAGA